MNIGTSTKKLALVAGVLGICGLGFLAPSASAKPKKEVKVVNHTTTVVRTRPVVEPRTIVKDRPVYRTRTIVKTQPVYRTRTIVRKQPVYRTRTIVQNRPVYRTRTVAPHRSTYRNPYTTRPSVYDGRVLSVSGGRLALNVGGNVYTVILASGLPRGTNRGDIVRVVGVRNGGSIRNARVSMLRNY